MPSHHLGRRCRFLSGQDVKAIAFHVLLDDIVEIGLWCDDRAIAILSVQYHSFTSSRSSVKIDKEL